MQNFTNHLVILFCIFNIDYNLYNNVKKNDPTNVIKDARFLKPKVIMCCDYINITMEIVQRLKKIS